MKTTSAKNCTCHTCGKDFHYLGIARHRTKHRDKRENCEISFTHGNRYLYLFSQIEKKPNWQITRYLIK